MSLLGAAGGDCQPFLSRICLLSPLSRICLLSPLSRMTQNLEKFRQQVRDKEDRIAKLQARASELEEGAVPQSAPSSLAPAPAPSSSTSTSPSFGATAAPSADASASAGRPQTRSVSPGPPGGRSDLSAAPMAVDEGKGEGADGGESALRNKLMARCESVLESEDLGEGSYIVRQSYCTWFDVAAF